MKPTPEQIDAYERELEVLLSALNVNVVNVIVRDDPARFYLGADTNKMPDGEYWLRSVFVNNPEVEDLEIILGLYNRMTGNSVMDKKAVWQDALDIQEAIYRKLGRTPGNPKDGDPYWRLWDDGKRPGF